MFCYVYYYRVQIFFFTNRVSFVQIFLGIEHQSSPTLQMFTRMKGPGQITNLLPTPRTRTENINPSYYCEQVFSCSTQPYRPLPFPPSIFRNLFRPSSHARLRRLLPFLVTSLALRLLIDPWFRVSLHGQSSLGVPVLPSRSYPSLSAGVGDG